MKNLILELKNTLNKRLVSVIMYGSKVKYEPEYVTDDINIMVIIDELSGADLRSCAPAVKKWIKNGNPPPVFMDKSEWFSSSDVYAMEYLDIKAAHRILYGEDVVSQVAVESRDVRFQCEQEAKNLLMRFRQFYLENTSNAKRLKDAFTPLTKTCNAIFKTILRLKNIDVPREKSDIITKTCEAAGLNAETFNRLLCYKRKQCRLNDRETIEFADKIVKSLSELLNYTNNM